ncbi:FkbM family methyltransferase [Danxiaibacter flavus]|uniref:FkbM family methyltransferase n=1 Tax=Danxiaibacter flavus TaxID=3049108 RepID=A0ABV3ZKX2_9BACT|nr:FkbM family methyltransferase [Chitinophagaceae bacterium DXS]
MTKLLKRTLFNFLGLDGYLSLLQKTYLLSYKAGFLKNNPIYAWHYFVKKLVREDDTVVDIGANLGYFASVFLEKLSSSGHLYCVEPVEPYRKQLRKITDGKKNVTLFSFALGNENKESIHLGMPAAFSDLGYLRHGLVTVETDERAIAQNITFNSSLKKASEVFAPFTKIDYIKCDIEGYETVVIPEMKDALLKHKPLVQLETWHDNLAFMINFFKEIGFEPFNLVNGKLVSCYTLPMDQINGSDVLFVPKEKRERIERFL